MKNKLLFLVLMAAVILAGFMTASLAQKAPLVPDVAVQPPDPSLPEELKALSGIWAGSWNSRGGWDCVIYVERIDGDTAQLVYSWGAYDTSKGRCHCDPDWRRIRRAKVTHSENRATLEFETRPLRPLDQANQRRTIPGTVDHSKGSEYTYSFSMDPKDPKVMTGHFVSGKGSQLRIEMKKITDAETR